MRIDFFQLRCRLAGNDAIMRRFDKNLITKQLRFLQFPDVADATILRRRYGAIASPLRKRFRDASRYTSKKYRSSFYS